LSSLDFLGQFTFLKELSVSSRYDQDFSFLSDLPQLESLDIGAFGSHEKLYQSFGAGKRSVYVTPMEHKQDLGSGGLPKRGRSVSGRIPERRYEVGLRSHKDHASAGKDGAYEVAQGYRNT
jgi:hypothetical protein